MTLSMLVSTVNMDAGIVKGRVYDSATNEPLIGATVIAGNHTQGASTDIDGHYTLQLTAGKYDFAIKYIGYRDTVISHQVPLGMEELILDIPMMPDVTSLSEVTVVAVARRDTEAAMIEEEKKYI